MSKPVLKPPFLSKAIWLQRLSRWSQDLSLTLFLDLRFSNKLSLQVFAWRHSIFSFSQLTWCSPEPGCYFKWQKKIYMWYCCWHKHGRPYLSWPSKDLKHDWGMNVFFASLQLPNRAAPQLCHLLSKNYYIGFLGRISHWKDRKLVESTPHARVGNIFFLRT